ncbi:MAG TPA: hypothetical protein VFV94_07515 [Polyangiaceae bacterium]|nr:hypothetical protein [Polyangiaceae bacterium]
MLNRFLLIATVGLSLSAATGCSGSSSGVASDDDDDDVPGAGGTSGGSGARGGSGGSSGTRASGGSGGSQAKGGSGGTSLAGACGLGPDDALRVTTANLAGALKGAISATAFVEGSALVGRALALGDNHEPPVFVDDATKEVDDLVDWLSQKVLAAGNALDSVGPTIRYALESEVYCAPDADDLEADPEWAKEQAADCAQDLAEHPVTFEVAFDGCDGPAATRLTITPTIGSAQATPFVLKTGPQWLSASFDVGQVVKYAAEQGSNVAFDGDSYGTPSLTLSAEDPNHVTLDVTLNGGLGVGFTDDDKHVRLESEASDAFFRGTVDAATRHVSGSFELGAASFALSFKTFVEAMLQRHVTPAVPPNDSVSIDVPASSIGFDYMRETDHFAIWRSSPAEERELASVKHGDDTLIRADLGESSNGARAGSVGFDVDWVAGGAFDIVADPGFSLDLTFALKSVADKIENLQSFASDDVVSFELLPGPSAGSIPEAASGNVALLLDDELDLALTHRTPGPQLLVNAGTFVMSSKSAGLKTTVETGQCLVYDPNSQVLHEILRGYGAAACPSVFK